MFNLKSLLEHLLSALAGWGPGVFTAYNHWWVVPVIACHVGAVAGAWLYYVVVERNWQEGENEEMKNEVDRKKEVTLPKMVTSGPGTNYLEVSTIRQY